MADTDDPGALGDQGPSGPPRTARVIVAIATVLAVLSVFTVWGRVQMLDTEEWVSLSSELLEEEEVREALAVYLVDTVYAEVDVAQSFADVLPEDLSGLGGPLAGIVRGPLVDGVERLLAADLVQRQWVAANELAHRTMVNILRDETSDAVSAADGRVVLELGTIVRTVGENLGISGDRLDRLPEDAGRIVIFESDELDTAQTYVKILDVLAWFLFAAVVVLYALAVYLARGHRLVILRSVGWSLVGVGVVVLAARALAARALVNAIVADPANEAAAGDVVTVATALLRQMGWSTLVYGILIVGFTSLLGSHRWAQATRRTVAPLFNAHVGLVAGGTVLVLLLLFAWQPGRAFSGWTTSLVLVALVIGAVIAIRQQTMREFPASVSSPPEAHR